MKKIAIEGPCCAGKSLCINRLLKISHACSIDEYNDFDHPESVYPPISEDDIWEATYEFSLLEVKRNTQLQDFTKKGYDYAFIDRSFMTLLAFQYAAVTPFGINMIDALEKFWEGSKYTIWPDLVIALNVSRVVQLLRAGDKKHRYMSVFFEEEFNQRFMDYIITYCNRREIELVIIDSSLLTPEQVVQEITKYL